MPEYYALRLLLGVLEGFLFLQLLHENEERHSLFSLFLLWNTIINLLPSHFDNPMWWRSVWTPMAMLQLTLSVGILIDVVSGYRLPFWHKGREQVYYAMLGMMISVIVWHWLPIADFSRFVIIRQYVLLAVLIGSFISKKLRVEFPLLPIWNLAAFVLACTAKNGFLWVLFTWNGNSILWRSASDFGMLIQILVAAGWCVALYFKPKSYFSTIL